ncbi:MAG TPA: sulfite exporter TauE/SafE family protein [Chromatiales bacterium]|nr:sulfite exporter TauE/SafE family protein [Chromatiales bacterium]
MLVETGLILAGASIATIAMTVGIGGGILWTPLLILAYGLTAQEAVATSLIIQIAGMGSGTIAFFRARLVETRLVLAFFLAAAPGVILGSLITVQKSQNTIQLALGIMALTLAFLFVSSTDDLEELESLGNNTVTSILPVPAFFGFMMGALSVGIGEWLIPALKHKLSLDMTRAIATVIPMMFLLAIVATSVHWTLAENIRLDYFAWGGLGTIIGGQVGVRLSQRMSERLLKQGFIYIMTLIGLHLIFQSI